ncbi:MAG TPA: hypothetical protein PK867_19210, partial [Pirellulales bacterium]|nr:hypothetical protein [Pirellulales bacterium]
CGAIPSPIALSAVQAAGFNHQPPHVNVDRSPSGGRVRALFRIASNRTDRTVGSSTNLLLYVKLEAAPLGVVPHPFVQLPITHGTTRASRLLSPGFAGIDC